MSDALQAALAARLGAQYEIEGLLGQGGMGSVFRARDTTLDRAVAIKVISGDLATNPELKDRFLLEARTVAKLRHPNIVAVYTAGEADGLLYFVMELVPGESLRDLMAREGKVAPQRTERILHELAMALDYAHSNGIVHRDVKPENILLDRETGRAMLTDFGVARALESSGNITGTGMILGSPRYMSPEQASGESTLDGRSDLYALALVGYEMLTGIPVVESGNVAGMLVKHLTEKPKPVAEAMPQAPEGLALALDRALEKDREHRWRNGREMAEVIGMAWTPTPGSGVHAGVAARMQRRSNLAFVLGAVVVVAGLLVGMGLKWLGARGGGDPRKSYAVVPFEIQSGNSEVQWLRDGAVNMLTLALSHWNDLSVVPYERTLNLVKDVGAAERRVSLDEAQTVARRGGAGTLVMGQVSTTRDSLIVVARLYDVRSGDPVNTVTRAAALGDDPRPLFDDLARYLLDVAGGSSSASVDVARATTASITAYRAYLDGVRLLNSWRLTEADSALSAAIAADSTFALAWHKRALALGWGGGGVEYIASAQRAVELADRLPPRQQALVRGHLALARGLFASDGGLGASTASLREAQRIYSELLAQDSLAAEGWYGLADAYFHDTPTTVDSLPAYQTRFNLALRAFHRTLEIDSTFHLAYQHLVQQYQQVSSPSFGGVLDGDSVVIPTTPDAAQRLTRVRSLEARRRDAEQRGLAIANGWMRADPDAPAAYLAVANGYVTSGRPDSAVAIIDRALTRPALATPGMQLQSILYYLFADEPVRAFARAEETLRAPVPTLRRAPVSERIVGFAVALGAAASVGNAAALDAYLERFVAVDSVFPYSNVPTRDVMEWYVTSLRTAVSGEISPAQRRYLLEGLRRVSGSADPVMAQAAAMSASVPLGAYLLTRDTVFSNAFRRLPNVGTSHTDLEALEALARGDTATARRIAESYTHPDSMANARFSFVGLRTLARAEVLAAVGNRTWAIAYLEALDPARYNSIGLGEPGFAFYTRSFLTRAALYEADGQPQKAIAALEEFLRRTEAGDEAIAPARREARAALARLRDR